MKALSIDQPNASLIMAGVKQWETRPSPPSGDMRPDGVRGLPGKRINRGERIAIHASKRWSEQRIDAFNNYDPTKPVYVDYLERLLHYRDDDIETAFERGAWTSGNTSTCEMDFGVILGTIEVVAAIPIRSHLENPHIEGPNPVLMDWSAWICHEVDIDRLTLDVDGCENVDISDQLAYGIWTPGRWAYELADVQPLPEPIPCKGKQGVWEWEAA